MQYASVLLFLSLMANTIFFNDTKAQSSCSTAVPVTVNSSCNFSSFTTTDSVYYFSFTASDSFAQIVVVASIARCSPGAHPHRLTLFGGTCSALSTLEDEFLPDISTCQELSIDASNLTVGTTYYIRVSRQIKDTVCVATPTPVAVCNASLPLSFQLCVRSFDILIPKDFGLELPAVSHSYYTNKGQIVDVNNIPRFDIRTYTNNSSPAVYELDSAVAFVFAKIDTIASTPDTLHRVDMVLTGANVQPAQRVFKTEKISGYLNYFLGHVPTGVTNVKGYSRTVQKEVYPNIDMQFYSNNSGVKFYFVRNPGGNPDDIQLQFNGAAAVNVTASGGLDILTMLGTISFEAGHAYAINPAGNIVPMPWQAKFVQINANTVKFDIHQFPQWMPLIIQVDRGHKLSAIPATDNLQWSTFFGGNAIDEFFDVTTDVNGNVYCTGYTYSNNFPITPGVIQDSLLNTTDAIAVKFKSNGELIWSTYCGGSLPSSGFPDDQANAIKVDGKGNVYFVGFTNNFDFPTFNPPGGVAYYQPTINPCNVNSECGDAFIVALNSTGDTIILGTYYGGTGTLSGGSEELFDLSIDNFGNIYIIGHSGSATPLFPKPGAYNSTIGNGLILKFSPQFQRLWATKISGATRISGIDIDNQGNKFITGITGNGFPILNAGANATYGGGQSDAYVMKLDINDTINWSTYLGGANYDQANDIIADGFGNCYVTGRTQSDSTSFPLFNPGLPIYFLGTYKGGTNGDAFISAFDNSGQLIWNTYYGGTDSDEGTGITVDANNNIYICGNTSSSDFPIPSPNLSNAFVQPTLRSGAGDADAFLVAFTSGRQRIWGTYFGGTSPFFPIQQGTDVAHSITTFQNSKLYLVGTSGSEILFPLNNGGGIPVYFDSTNTIDGFISRFDISIMPVGVKEEDSFDNEIMIFPNPSSANITLRFSSPINEKIKVNVYDNLGKTVYSKDFKSFVHNTVELDLPSLCSGIYLLQVTFGYKSITRKLTVSSKK